MNLGILVGIIVLIIVIILALGIIHKVFGLVFKIAIIALVIIAGIASITMYDLHRQDITTKEVQLVFTNASVQEVQGGFLFNESKIQRELTQEELFNITNEDFSRITIVVVTNTSFENISIQNGNVLQQYKNYREIFRFFKNETVFFRPSTIGFTVVESLQ